MAISILFLNGGTYSPDIYLRIVQTVTLRAIANSASEYFFLIDFNALRALLVKTILTFSFIFLPFFFGVLHQIDDTLLISICQAFILIIF